MTIVDSSVWISFYNNKDKLHEKAYKEITELFNKEYEIIVPENVISEVYTVLLYKCDKEKAIKFLNFAINSDKIKIIFINQFIFNNTYKFLSNTKKKLSFVDLTLISLSQELSCTLLTYDKDILSMLGG